MFLRTQDQNYFAILLVDVWNQWGGANAGNTQLFRHQIKHPLVSGILLISPWRKERISP
jgi:hypothetical protein